MNSTSSAIVSRLESSGMMMQPSYTHDQLLDQMKGFELAALREVFREDYSENLRTYDLLAHLRSIASKYSLEDTEVFRRLTWELNAMSREISALVNGARGERYMERALGWLKCPHELLLNVELEYEGERCEYDALVLSPSGIDIIESKFCTHDAVIDQNGFYRSKNRPFDREYNVGEKMRAKEYVLYNVIQASSPGTIPRTHIRSIFFAANNYSTIEDRFGLIDVCNSGQVCPLIESQTTDRLDEDALAISRSAIEEARQTFQYESDIDFDQLRSDLADFMAISGRAAANSTKEDAETYKVAARQQRSPQPGKTNTKAFPWREVLAAACPVIGACTVGIAFSHLSKRFV